MVYFNSAGWGQNAPRRTPPLSTCACIHGINWNIYRRGKNPLEKHHHPYYTLKHAISATFNAKFTPSPTFQVFTSFNHTWKKASTPYTACLKESFYSLYSLLERECVTYGKGSFFLNEREPFYLFTFPIPFSYFQVYILSIIAMRKHVNIYLI